MARKAAALATEGDDSAAAPRRSGRIASIPVAPAEVKKETKRKPSNKRSAPAAESEENGGESKKAKAAAKEETENTEDVAPGEDADPPTAKLAPIAVGDALPAFTLKNEKNEDVDVQSLTSEKGLVLFLVPRANTPGCTNQACGFRDIYPDFTGLEYEVYCLSADTPSVQSNWQTKKELPYPLLSDPKRVLIGALGAADGEKTKRSHFIFEKGGKLVDKKVPVKPLDSPKLALEFIKSQAAES